MIPVAVVGVGQTHHKTRRRDVSVGVTPVLFFQI